MVQPTYVVALQELKTIPAPEHQLTLLRLLKNDIVGHGQRKEHVVRQGLLDALAQLLLSTTKSNGKKAAPSHTPDQLSLEQDIRLQATLIIGSLANAGPSFVPPILASDLTPALSQALDPSETPPKILVATLRTLNNISSAWASLVFASPVAKDLSFANRILSKPTIAALIAILQQTSTSSVVQQQIALAADLVTHCCLSDVSRNLLVKEGLLDALANLLASFALSKNASSYQKDASSFDVQSNSCNILNALSAVIEGSNYRAQRLLYSPFLRKVLTLSKERTFFDDTQGPNFQRHQRPSDVISVENLLPKIPVQKSVSYGSHSFPALALAGSRLMPNHSVIDSPPSSPLCVWLIHLSRSQPAPSSRIAALRLLALVSQALDADPGGIRPDVTSRSTAKERQIALLAVPIAVKLVKDSANAKLGRSCDPKEALILKSEACAVLARLIKGNSELQKAAHSADAHKYIAQILKRSFDPVALARPMWSPQSQNLDQQNPASLSTTLGDGGLPQEVVYTLRCRAGALEAVAAISEAEDSIRKDLIEAGVAGHIIDSLTPFPDVPASAVASYQAKDGNTIPVILAACQAATAMSRSVGNLRTSLIDAGLAKPIFALLKHSDNAVQIAATDVSINLVLDFSPMREDLINAGVIQIFCTHAKRSSPDLRKASLWGLKHLVLNAPQAIKHACLEELGSGWLIQAISGEQLETHTSQPMGMSTSNARGQQVDLLNAPESPEMDIDQARPEESDGGEGEEEEQVSYDQSGFRYQSSGLRTTLEPADHKARLRMFREQEFNPTLQARREDVAIQEQALDFIRNLINGDDNVAMIDHLNTVIGANRIFDMLYNKLKPAVTAPAPTHGFTLGQRQAYTQTQSQLATPTVPQFPELIRAALGVLIHLAAGSSKHRQQLVAQKQLLTAWLPHFNHPDRQVRVSSVWGIINLTWSDTAGDREDARHRAMELRSIGIEDRVRSLANDGDLDVRERVKNAMRQIDELLGVGRQR